MFKRRKNSPSLGGDPLRLGERGVKVRLQVAVVEQNKDDSRILLASL